MSKITNDGLTSSRTGCCSHMATVGVKGLIKVVRHNLTMKYTYIHGLVAVFIEHSD